MAQRSTSSLSGSDLHIIDAAALPQYVDIHSEMEGDPTGRLDLVCGAITNLIEAYTGRAFKQRVVTEYLDGNGQKSIVTTHAPLIAITSLKHSNTSAGLDDVDALTEDEDFSASGDQGVLWRINGTWVNGRGNVLIEYEAGYGTAAMEYQVAMVAFILQFNATWREWDKKLAGLTSSSYGDKTLTKPVEGVVLLPEAREMLDSIRRIRA